MDAQLNEKIAQAVNELPPELHDVATRWFEQLEVDRDISDLLASTIEPLVRLVACSEFAAKTCIRNPEIMNDLIHTDDLFRSYETNNYSNIIKNRFDNELKELVQENLTTDIKARIFYITDRFASISGGSEIRGLPI